MPLGLLPGSAGDRKPHCPWPDTQQILLLGFGSLSGRETAPTSVWSTGEKVPLPQPLLVGLLLQTPRQLIWRRNRKRVVFHSTAGLPFHWSF